jgi:HSP20 family protein
MEQTKKNNTLFLLEEKMTLYIANPYTRMRRMMEQMLENDGNSPRNLVTFPLDVKVEDNAYLVTAYLPGVKSDDLSVNVVNDTLTIEGEIKHEQSEKEANYLVQECVSGNFSRSLTLPDAMDTAKAEATLKDGVLTLRLPKVEAALPKAIKVIVK